MVRKTRQAQKEESEPLYSKGQYVAVYEDEQEDNFTIAQVDSCQADRRRPGDRG
jgi:hypothetical protein